MTRPCGRPARPPGYRAVTWPMGGKARRVYLPADVVAGLEAEARGEGRSRAATLRLALARHYHCPAAGVDAAIAAEREESGESWSDVVRRVLSGRFSTANRPASRRENK